MYFHGGGWVLGGFDTHDRLVKELSNGAHAAIVFVNYTRSPEARYPDPLEQAYAATKWVEENAHIINVNSSRLAVVGDSVGGNMAAAVSYLRRSEEDPESISKCSSIRLPTPILIHILTQLIKMVTF